VAPAAIASEEVDEEGPELIADFDAYDGDLADWGSAVVVVGCGPVGIAVSRVLRRRHKRVVVLEAGPYTPVRGHSSSEVELSGLDFTGGVGRGTGLGGGSAFWAGQTMRFHASDFSRRDWIPESGWPLSIDDLLPYYAEAESDLGVSADDYYSQTWRRYGVDPLSVHDDNIQTRMSIFASKADIFDRAQRAFEQDQGILVLFNATATEFRRRDDTIHSLVVRSESGKCAEVSAQSYVLCVGAIETARLFLTPSPDFPSGVGNLSGHVGRHFQDHPNGVVASVAGTPTQLSRIAATYALFYGRRGRVLPKIVASAEQQEKSRVLNACVVPVYTWPEESVTAALKQVQEAVAGRSFDLGVSKRVLSALRRPGALARTGMGRMRGRPYVEAPEGVGLHVYVEQPPAGSGAVTLSKSNGRLGMPMARVEWVVGEEEANTARNLVSLVREQFRRTGLGEVRPLPELAETGGFQTIVEDSQHHAGTARMALTESAGVCDVRGRVFGLTNLYVAGGALFPTSSYANPTLTMIAVGSYVATFLP
jgi:choline dehydrogenase-like flavoprotein